MALTAGIVLQPGISIAYVVQGREQAQYSSTDDHIIQHTMVTQFRNASNPLLFVLYAV
jgi:hypothetical protein